MSLSGGDGTGVDALMPPLCSGDAGAIIVSPSRQPPDAADVQLLEPLSSRLESSPYGTPEQFLPTSPGLHLSSPDAVRSRSQHPSVPRPAPVDFTPLGPHVLLQPMAAQMPAQVQSPHIAPRQAVRRPLGFDSFQSMPSANAYVHASSAAATGSNESLLHHYQLLSQEVHQVQLQMASRGIPLVSLEFSLHVLRQGTVSPRVVFNDAHLHQHTTGLCGLQC